MKKRLLASVTAAVITLFAALMLTMSVSAETAPKGAIAPGGNVTTAEQLLSALGGEDNAELSKDGYTVYLKRDIHLNRTISITTGSYRLIGRGCAIYRGFSSGAMIQLMGQSLTDKEGNLVSTPSLVIGTAINVSEQDLEEPDIILDGNRSGFSEAVAGPILAAVGKSDLTINPSTVLTNNYSSAPGGAIYLEALRLGDEYSPLDPSLTVNGGKICGNSSMVDGGAIYAMSDLNGNSAGKIQLNGCEITGNTVTNDQNNGRGGAICALRIPLILSTCNISSNQADLGGGIYTDSDTVISNCTFKLNRANVGGGAIYGYMHFDQDTNAPMQGANINLISTYMIENHSDGYGGAIVNYGKLTFPKENGSYVSDNTSKGDGALIFNRGTLLLESGEFFSNESSEGRGGIYNSGTVELTDADIRHNSAAVGGGIYNLGTLNIYGGCLNGNKCTVKNAPQIANIGNLYMKGSFVIENDVIGLFRSSGEPYEYTNIQLMDNITTNVKINVAFYAHLPENGAVTEISLLSPKGLTVFSGLKRYTEKAAEKVSVLNPNGSYSELTENGVATASFPVFAIILISVGGAAILIGGAVTAVLILKKKKTAQN